ncbi:winged helix-turn-helix transcriptional regulator [Amycolatopsis sp. OK19-0408]|uniref:Winged helix-turn-helix transcriptional regulator n=1 Tax=Amycolatopsis iheyensis TaxID=2945988 RepID=A0A9X2SK69_9PSEU|nr:winged helix-turn-helix transcriptional regulator [Amycolatopsis iheyensis]MCR6483551.1 winged helix-turn-helix transcriptional regulator [Amycolatopsis iheyensis]
MTTTRTYGQFCGLARALEIVGERWSMLVLRDLMLGPKRYTDLRLGLPRIPAGILSSRLNELEQAGVIRRRVLPQLDAGLVYELTEYGSELDHILLDLGLWGARSLGYPKEGDVFTDDAAILALYATFQEEAARGVHVTYVLRHSESLIIHAMVDDGALKVSGGDHPAADLVIEPQGPELIDLVNGTLTAAEAMATGRLRIEGEFAHLELFTKLFHIPPKPAEQDGLALH